MKIAKICFLFLWPIAGFAATDYTWQPVSGVWSDAANWDPNTGPPVSGDTIIFDGNVNPTSSIDVDVTVAPGNMTFQNGVAITLTDNPLTLGGFACPSISFNAESTGTWSSSLTLAGDFALQGASGAATLAGITSSLNADLTIGQGITCNLTQAALGWTTTTTTVSGTLSLQASNSLPTAASVVLGDGTSAVLTSGNTQEFSNLTGGVGGQLNLTGSLTLDSAAGTCNETVFGFFFDTMLNISSPSTYTFMGTGHDYRAIVNVTQGKLQSGVSGSLPSSSAGGQWYQLADTAGVVLDLNGTNCTIAGLRGGGTSGGDVILSTAISSGYLALMGGSNGGTYNGMISDGGVGYQPGTIELRGNLLALTRVNSYSGGTVITGGTLQASSMNNLGIPASSVYALVINGFNNSPTFQPTGNFDFVQGGSLGILIGNTATIDTSLSSMTISAPIVGLGTLRKIGSNTLVLTNPSNSYSAGTVLGGGVLRISNAGNLGTPGVSRFLIDFQSGTLQPTAVVTLPQLGSGINITSTGTIDTSLSSMTISAQIGGAGSLTTTGSSGNALTLSGTNSYTGTTTVQSGILIVNGSLATGAVAVNTGATLKGIGTINGPVTVNSGGALQPGTSIGTQNYTAGLTIASNGTLVIEINGSGQTSSANVTGLAILNSGAQLQIVADPGTYSPTIYPPLLIADGIAGAFATPILFTPPPGLFYQLLSTPTTIQLQLFLATIALDLQSGNNKILAEYLNDFPFDTFGAPWIALLSLSASEQASALETISPSRNAALTFNSYNLSFTFSQLLDFRSLSQRYFNLMKGDSLVAQAEIVRKGTGLDDLLGKTSCKPRQKTKKRNLPYSIWLTGFGDLARQEGENQNPTFHMKNGGLLLGIERYYADVPTEMLDDIVFGGALGYAYSSVVQDNHFGSGQSKAAYASLYNTLYFHNQCYFDFSFWGNGQHMQNTRNIFYPGYSATSTNSHNAWGGDLHGAFGYDYRFINSGVLEPFLSMDWAFLEEESYVEKGSNVYNMFTPNHFSSMVRTEAGTNLLFSWFAEQCLWTLRTKLSYVNKIPLSAVVTAGIVGAPSTFTVAAFSNTQNLFSVAGEFALLASGGGYFSIFYDGEFGSGYTYNQLTAKVGCDF